MHTHAWSWNYGSLIVKLSFSLSRPSHLHQWNSGRIWDCFLGLWEPPMSTKGGREELKEKQLKRKQRTMCEVDCRWPRNDYYNILLYIKLKALESVGVRVCPCRHATCYTLLWLILPRKGAIKARWDRIDRKICQRPCCAKNSCLKYWTASTSMPPSSVNLRLDVPLLNTHPALHSMHEWPLHSGKAVIA